MDSSWPVVTLQQNSVMSMTPTPLPPLSPVLDQCILSLSPFQKKQKLNQTTHLQRDQQLITPETAAIVPSVKGWTTETLTNPSPVPALQSLDLLSSAATAALVSIRGESSASDMKRCEWQDCSLSFPDARQLTLHLLSLHIGHHRSTYTCEWTSCTKRGYSFHHRTKMERHLSCHTGLKPYRCESCPKAFSEASVLMAHIRMHTGERPFQCPVSSCGASFRLSGALTIHARRHVNERPFSCPQCEKRFAESSNLRKHVRTHTGERPFQCRTCERAFARSDQLKRHERALHPE